MMRVLVTGAWGYIGGRLVRSLAASNKYSLTAASRIARTAPEGVAAGVTVWNDPEALAGLCRGQDAIVHLAAMAEPDGERDPETALTANGLATLRLLAAAEKAGVRRFVTVSTAKVFGANPSGAIDEQSLPRPASHYAITHRLAEDYVLALHDKGKLEGCVLRLSNAIGAPADPKTPAWPLIANDLCRQAATVSSVTLRSSGLAWRNFVAMNDVVAALKLAIEMPAGSLSDGLFHVGGPTHTTIWDLAKKIGQRAETKFGGRVALSRVEPCADELHPRLDWRIDKLRAAGWTPSSNLDREIDATLDFCRHAFGPT